MTMEVTPRLQPFESFALIYKILVWTGYYRLMKKPKHNYIVYLHYLYSCIVFIWVIIYNIQHLIYTVQVEDKDESFASLMIEIPQLNLVIKIITLRFGIPKLEKLHELLRDPIFGAGDDEDEKYLKKNKDFFIRLIKVSFVVIFIIDVIWIMTTILGRINDPDFTIPSYFPFCTNTVQRFALAVFLEHGLVIWLGYGHLSMDILIACYYSQATVQLKILRYNLRTFCHSDKKAGYVRVHNKQVYRYIDELDPKIHDRFVKCVRRYDKIFWFVGQVNSIFNNAISFQAFMTSCVICTVIYRMSVVPPTSLAFMFLVGYFVILQFQVFLYCFYGELVKYESNFIADSVYESEWLMLSPRFRRQLLIAMARWSIPIKPTVLGVVKLSLSTFVTVIRSAINLFTVLKTTNNETT